MRILCVFGKYSYGDPSRGISPEYASFIPALKRLGHEVIHFESWNRRNYKDFAELNRSLLSTIKQESIDILLTVQLGYEIWLETLKIIRSFGNVATVCWTTDDSWKYREVSRYIGKSYHVMTTNYENVVPFYHRDGIPNVCLTQWAANADLLLEPIPARKCHYPVTFVGTAHGNRKQYIAELRKHGIEVTCFGHGWPNGPVSLEEISRIMQQSVISLNFANSKGENQIKARTFEVPGAGGFLLTEYTTGIEKFYKIDEEITIYKNSKELAQKINYYLSHPEERDRITISGFKRTAKDHLYDHRMKQILAFLSDVFNGDLKEDFQINPNTFEVAENSHNQTLLLRIVRWILNFCGTLIWGRTRGPRAARRIVYEISWRFFGKKTYTAAGLPGRLFPEL